MPHDELAVSEPPRTWHEENGVIRFSVTSDGATGEQWITRLKGKDFRVSNYPRQVLCSSDLLGRQAGFKPTNGVTTEVAVLKGDLFTDIQRTTMHIRAEARYRNFTTPNAEIACLIRELLTDGDLEAMGVWGIIAMHEPINDFDGDPELLGASRIGNGRWLGAYVGWLGRRWDRDYGFAFAAS